MPLDFIKFFFENIFKTIFEAIRKNIYATIITVLFGYAIYAELKSEKSDENTIKSLQDDKSALRTEKDSCANELKEMRQELWKYYTKEQQVRMATQQNTEELKQQTETTVKKYMP